MPLHIETMPVYACLRTQNSASCNSATENMKGTLTLETDHAHQFSQQSIKHCGTGLLHKHFDIDQLTTLWNYRLLITQILLTVIQCNKVVSGNTHVAYCSWTQHQSVSGWSANQPTDRWRRNNLCVRPSLQMWRRNSGGRMLRKVYSTN